MKKNYIYTAFLLIPFFAYADLRFPLNEMRQKFKISGKQDDVSQSFLFTRPAYRNIEARELLAHEFFADKNCWGTGWQVYGIWQESGSSDRIGRYYALNEKNLITVKGDSVEPINRDVRAEWLGLDDNFNGCLQLKPKQRQWAAVIELQQDLKQFTDNWLLTSLYLSFQLPIQSIKNDINFEQLISVPSERPGPTDLKEAFNRCELKKARIPLVSDTKTGVPEIITRFGAYFMNEDGYELGLYSLLHIPTTSKLNADFLFEPFLGHNDHWGFGSGINIQLPLNCSTDKRVFAFYIDAEHLFLLRRTQWRTLDLKEKQWSRYLLLNKTDGQRNIPAANALTRKVRVEPFSQVDVSGGFRLYNDHVAFQFGYSVWAHGREELRLKEPWLEEYGIAGQDPDPMGRPLPMVNCVPVGPTASKSDIACRQPNDTDDEGNLEFVPIRWRDLNFFSGAARSAVASRMHAAFGMKIDSCNVAFFAGVGVFGEFVHRNTAFTQWGAWGKVGATF